MTEVFYVKDVNGNLVAAKFLQDNGTYVQDPNAGTAANIPIFDANGNPIADANPNGNLIVPADYSVQKADQFVQLVSDTLNQPDAGIVGAYSEMLAAFDTYGPQDQRSTDKGDPGGTEKPETTEPTYIAYIRLSKDWLDTETGRTSLGPGITVTTEIHTGRRRIIDYSLSPLQRSVSESLHER